MNISNLIVEVTRKCNMACDHCLRGNAQNADIDFQYIDSLLSQLSYICTVTFTGGEPSLNVKAIDYFLMIAKKLGVGIGGFYIATNGMTIKEEFVMACLRLYSYCDEKEMCLVDISNDQYHAAEGAYDTELLDGLSFIHRKYEKERYNFNHNQALIMEGRAKENFTDAGRKPDKKQKIETVDDFNDTEIYLNVHGDIINGCDWSYTSQKKNKLCFVSSLKSYYETLTEE